MSNFAEEVMREHEENMEIQEAKSLKDKTRSEGEAFTILKNLTKTLECTNPPEDLAKLIGYDKINFSGVSPYIESDGYRVYVSMELLVPYEHSEWESIPLEHEIFDKYC